MSIYTPNPKKPTFRDAQNILAFVDYGLSEGVGDEVRPKRGKVCVEFAVSIAMGEPENVDGPSCVNKKVRSDKIALNDVSLWGSNKNRARGLRRVAVAQLGSNSNKFGAAAYRRELSFALLATFGPEARLRGDTKLLERLVQSTVDRTDLVSMLNTWLPCNKKTLPLIAECVVTALRRAKSPGIKWMDKLCPLPKKKN